MIERQYSAPSGQIGQAQGDSGWIAYDIFASRLSAQGYRVALEGPRDSAPQVRTLASAGGNLSVLRRG
jgi:hypothetical protein